MAYQVVNEDMRARSPDQARMARLLGRYPGVSAEEIREMVTFMRSGRHVDIILLSHDDRLRPQLDAFMRDHRRQLRANWGQGATVVAGLVALMIALWVILEALNGFSTGAADHLASSLSIGNAR